MKNLVLFLSVMVLISFGLIGQAQAQGASRGPDKSILRDPELESEAKHNLEVARHYFKLKKAYVAALSRCEEIIAAYPLFSNIDEVFYMAGVSSLRLSESKGKQKAKSDSEKLRDDARIYLSQLVNDYADSQFKTLAEKELERLGGPLKSSKQQ